MAIDVGALATKMRKWGRVSLIQHKQEELGEMQWGACLLQHELAGQEKKSNSVLEFIYL